MAPSSQGYDEREELLPARTKDLHRAIVSLREELGAVDGYQQRVDAVEDPELREILQHHRDEAIAHACRVIEWLRRNDPVFRRQLALRTGHDGPIVSAEEEREAAGARRAGGGAGQGPGDEPKPR